MEKTIAIIGAGIAGLAAGCYAQMNGYQSHIFELHDLPGGLCTAWERKGYTFDGCLHYLLGSAPGQPFNQVWQELGAVQGRPMIHHEELMRIIGPGGETFVGYCDPDRLADHIKQLSPEDGGLADDLAEGIRAFLSFDMSALQTKPRSLMTGPEGLELGKSMLPFMLPLIRWAGVSSAEFAERFHSPFLRCAFPYLFGWSAIPMMAAISLTSGDAIRNVSVTDSGMPAATKPMNRGMELHEQNGVTTPSTTARTKPTNRPRPSRNVRARSRSSDARSMPTTNMRPSRSRKILTVS